jgi:hypothetical protein
MIQLQTHDHFGRQQVFSLDRNPDECPICHHGVEPKDARNDCLLSSGVIERVLRCPRLECGHFFVARYANFGGQGQYKLQSCLPLNIADAVCSAEVIALSPNFYAIYNQAHKAEKSEWVLVAGPGYRKALEFLIKDYAMQLQPGAADHIKKIELGPCIQEYMKNEMVRETAKRAAWLGNDETHYSRKWEGKDLQDLKDLLALVIVTIQGELLFEALKKDMPAGKK